MDKQETIARTLFGMFGRDDVYQDIPLTDWQWNDNVSKKQKEHWNQKAEAVIKALEADVPASMVDYLLNTEEIDDINPFDDWGENLCKAQLAKVVPYIEAQVKAERLYAAKMMVRHRRTEISPGQLRTWLGIDEAEFKKLLRGE